MADCVVNEMAEEQNGGNAAEASAVSDGYIDVKLPAFTGSHDHGVDSKGRLIIPACYREALGNPFVTCLTLDFKSIALYPAREWAKQMEWLNGLKEKDIRVQKLIDRVCRYSYTDSEIDSQGRLLLPAKLRSKILGEARDVVICGSQTYLTIEPAELTDEKEVAFEAEYPDTLAFIAEVQSK